MDKNKLQDHSPMPYGKHIGTKMANIPAHYLIWLHENKKCSGVVKEYIEENIDVLKNEVANA